MQGKGLSGSYKFTRGPCIYSTSMVAVEVTLVNNSEAPISNICVGEKVSLLKYGAKFLHFSAYWKSFISMKPLLNSVCHLMFYRN